MLAGPEDPSQMRFQRLSRYVALASIPLVLASCADGTFLIEDLGNNSNIIQDSLPGSTTRGGGSNTTNPDNGTGGSGTTPEAGTNPTSISLSSDTGIYSLYPDKGSFSLSLSGARVGIAAVSSLNAKQPLTFQMDWTAAGARYQAQSAGVADEAPSAAHESRERQIAEHVRSLPRPSGAGTYRVQSGDTWRVGERRNFSVPIYETGGVRYETVAADAFYVEDSAKGKFIIWVADDSLDRSVVTTQKVADLAIEIRDRIYATDTNLFGTDTTTAQNNAEASTHRIEMTDDYVHFLFSRHVDNWNGSSGNGVLGFFTLGDLLPTSSNSGSNRAKILYIASSSMAQGRSVYDLYATIAHEFQHLLFSCHRVRAVGLAAHVDEFVSSKLAWLNEGLSMLAMFANGNGPDGANPSPSVFRQIRSFLSDPGYFSLTDFFNQGPGGVEDAYGMSALYLQYVRDRLGDSAIRSFHTFNNGGSVDATDLADRVMRARSTSMGEVFADFGAALAMDGTIALDAMPSEQRARYGISGVDLRGSYTKITSLSVAEQRYLAGPAADTRASANVTLRPYSLSFLLQNNLSSSAALKVSNLSSTGYGTRLILQK